VEIPQVQWPPEPLEAINRVRKEFAGELVVAGRYVLGIYPVKLGAQAGSERVGVLIVQRDLSRQLTRARRTVGQHTVQMVGVIAGLAVILGVLLHLVVTRRLNVLLNATQRFAAGSLEVRAKLRGSDEVAILGQAFDRMAEQVTDTQRQLERLAYHDALTGLPNRALFMDRLEHALAQAGRHDWRLALLFVDLDHFKAINDTLGHAAGDALLQQIGRRVERLLRAEDTVARLGGDEFVILLHGLSATHDAAHVASKAAAILAVPFEVDGHELHVTASIGISLFPRDGTDSTTLLKHADAALYQAKERGRNTYVYFNPD
ncbi:MAG: diguanylate cyclase domain-containing protein, partial [Gammaproteobacteria bacterium]